MKGEEEEGGVEKKYHVFRIPQLRPHNPLSLFSHSLFPCSISSPLSSLPTFTPLFSLPFTHPFHFLPSPLFPPLPPPIPSINTPGLTPIFPLLFLQTTPNRKMCPPPSLVYLDPFVQYPEQCTSATHPRSCFFWSGFGIYGE